VYLNNLITIVIPCKNEGGTIKKTLSLLNDQYRIEGTDVIISDSSNDNGFTRKMIESESENNLKIKIVEGGLPSIARNKGSKGIKTKYVLFIDADIFIEDKLLIYDIVNESNLSDLDLSTCKITTKDFYALAYSSFDFIRDIFLRNTPFAIGGFMLFKTETFREIGEFDEESKIAEDFQISKKIHPKKFKIFNRKAFTSSRRFKNKGLLYMIRIMIDCWINQNDRKFYTRDYNYFK
jgi:glycosyltransferase involved in cell wall biosynthesis